MKRAATALIFLASALFADTSETVFFRGVMLPSNEVPALSIAATGNATIAAHLVRNDAGKIISGSVDFTVNYVFPGAVTLTGLHIHAAPAGVNGSITIPTDLGAGAASIVSDTGVGTVERQAAVLPTNQAALDTLNGMMTDPSQYYVNLHTTDNPGGVMRAQLQRADVVVLMGVMSPANETPPIDSTANGVSHVTVLATRNATGAFTSGQVIFDINYNFGKATTISGYHIHSGGAGVAGPVIINTGINGTTAAVQTDATGAASLRRTVEVDVTNAAQLDTLTGLFTHPRDYYINMHTLEFPAGLIRDQLRRVDEIKFNVTMLPSNEVPPVAIDASAPAQVTIRTVRNEDGTVLAGTTTFDVNYRFPAAHVEFTGLHVHDGAAGINGPVRLNSALSATNSVVSETGFGNIYRFATMSDPNAVATLNSLVQNPEKHYVNLHTTVNGGGVIRSQLMPVNNAMPVVSTVTSGAKGTGVAPGGLMTILGTDLAKIPDDLSGWLGQNVPTSFDGSSVTVAGKNSPIIYVSPGQINAQVPADVAPGSQPVVVTNSNGAGAAKNVTIAAAAPAAFADLSNLDRGIIEHGTGGLIGPASPARVGENVVIWVTGLGQTTPALTTGAIVGSAPQLNTAAATVTIGGQDARVGSSIAAPGTIGIYLVTVTVPTVTPGDLPVVVKIGAASSDTVRMWVQ